MYRQYDQAALDAQYNLRERHPDHETYFRRWEEEGERVRRELECTLDVRFDPAPGATLDVFPARNAGAPLLLFIHGGYWQWRDKRDFSFLAEGPVNAGFSVVVNNYDLAPTVTLDEIVRQNRAALAWIYKNAEICNGDRSRIIVSGHSAGGHLTAVLAATDWSAWGKELGEELPADPIKGACAISGLYDLEPLRLCYLNEALRLDEAEAYRNSPLHHLPDRGPPLVVAVGGDETEEFLRHSAEFAAAWVGGSPDGPAGRSGLEGEHLVLPGLNHFSILDDLGRPEGALLQTMVLLGKAGPATG